MANPNVLGVSTILGNTASIALTSTNATQILNNPVSSGKILKLNTLIVTNIAGNTSANVTVNFYSEDDLGGSANAIAYLTTVPAGSSLVVLDKNTPIYVPENMSLGATAGTSNGVSVIASWEELN